MITASVALLILGALEAAAVPTASAPESAGFKVDALPNPHFVRDGPSALRKAYRKYGWPMPENIRTAGLQKRQASVPATSVDGDLEYICPVTIGDPKKVTPVTLNLDFDTGSSDLWVISNKLPTNQQKGHNVYKCDSNPCLGGGGGGGGDNPPPSNTCKNKTGWALYCCKNKGSKEYCCSHQTSYWCTNWEDPPSKIKREASKVSAAAPTCPTGTWSISYGDGSTASGTVVGDVVTLGGASVTNMAVECATKVSDSFVGGAEDGLLGLGFSSINSAKPQEVTWIEQYVKQQNVEFCFTSELKHNEVGSYTFGKCPDYSKSAHATIDSSGGWYQFACGNYAIGSGAMKSYTCTDGAIADTGTTLMLADKPMVDAYYKTVTGAKYDSSQGAYLYPCSSKLQDFTVWIGTGATNKITIKGEYMNYGPESEGSSTCYGGLQYGMDGYPGIWGDVFLKNGVAVYDGGKNAFGYIQ